jgi:DNA (cytosine-5)-methyltransferase 1
MEELTIYDMMFPKYKIEKLIRLIELFSGYGSQALALKYLGVNFEHWKTCEWAIKSIQAYKDIHFPDTDIELNPNRTKEDMIEFLYQKGISSNWNEPMTKEQVSRLSEEQLKTIIKNIAITHNLVNIQQVKGEDLEIVDTDKYCYIMTYSFPCQDLSLAGKGKGMSDTTTRSGMLWEVERILGECKNKPQVLLMENVPQVHGEGALQDFIKWQLRLEELGYKNYWQDLIATDYEIPQTRNRCFMVSILGDYNYTFPKSIPLKLRLKDMLEDNVDKKYYLPEKYYENIEWYEENKNQIAYLNYSKQEQSNRVWNIENVSPTLCASYKANDYLQNIKIKINNKIRVLTCKEAFRLMGLKDKDIDNVLKNQSDSSSYHLAGDSIVVNVLMAIFKEML